MFRKITKRYYFSVEGETEKWYLNWLQNEINNQLQAIYRVSIVSKVQDPLKMVKSLTMLSKIEITHLFDYESNDEIHTNGFKSTLDRLRKAEKSGKQVKYNLGYSNFAFELWIVLHKADCNASLIHRRQYLEPINRAYNENFENVREYKREDNFKRLLGRLSIQDVICAIERAKHIMQRNIENGYVMQQYKRYKYCGENPSLSIWESVEKILKDCRLI